MSELFVSNLDPNQATLSHDEALIQGRAADGGVLCFNPNRTGGRYPEVTLEELKGLAGGTFTDIAKLVIQKLVGDDVPAEELDRVAEQAYQEANFPLAPAGKVVTITEIYNGIVKGNISNGCTGSFKDNGMSHLAYNTQRVVKRLDRKLVIAGSTTGDTGPSAMRFFRNLYGIDVAMFSPYGESASSPVQNAQMEAYADDNIHNIKVRANFDQISALLQKIKGQPGFTELGAVNSVNIARVIPQVVTHFGLHLETVGENVGQKVDIAIPSGNFGDALSAYYARAMGLPIGEIILGNTDKNNALHNLVQHGKYDKRESEVTIASAMDIMAPANLPRLIFDMLHGDVDRMVKFTNRYNRLGGVALSDVGLSPNSMKEWGFDSDTVTREEIIGCIADVYKDSGEIIDPHTAVAVAVAKRRVGKTDNPMIAYETALPVKFEGIIERIIGFKPPRPAHFADLEQQAKDNPHKTRIIDASEEEVAAILAPLM